MYIRTHVPMYIPVKVGTAEVTVVVVTGVVVTGVVLTRSGSGGGGSWV